MLHLIESAAGAPAEQDWSGEALSAARQLERWRRRRRVCERLAIAASVPLACLVIAAFGIERTSVRIIVGLWGLTLLSILACATAIAHAEGRIAGIPPRARRRLYPVD